MAISFFENSPKHVSQGLAAKAKNPTRQRPFEGGFSAQDYYSNPESYSQPTGSAPEQYRQSQDNLTKAYQGGDLEQQYLARRQSNDAETNMANAQLDPSQIDPNTGNTLGFQEKIKAILNQGNRAFEQAQNPNLSTNFSSTVARNLEGAPDWARQNPFNMGYEWNEDAMRQGGLTDEDIADYRSIQTMDPRMIENLYGRGFLRAPYREYLAEQERLRAIAEEQARQAAVAASYSGGNEGGDPPPPPAVVQPSHNFTGDIENEGVPGDYGVMPDFSTNKSPAQTRHERLYGRPNKFL